MKYILIAAIIINIFLYSFALVMDFDTLALLAVLSTCSCTLGLSLDINKNE